MWPLSLVWKYQVFAEDDPALKECRICLGGDEAGQDWVAPCRCPRAIVWVHRSCLTWRLKYTSSGEGKLRCAVCKYAYKKSLRLKSFREWCDGWSALDAIYLGGDFMGLLNALHALLIFLIRATLFEEDPWWLSRLLVYVYIPAHILVAVLLAFFHIRAAYRQPQRFGLALYKRLLAVTVRDWILDAPLPCATPLRLLREDQVQDRRR